MGQGGDMPKISVITPTNSTEFYARAKKSLLCQTEKDWEWIVLWNGGVRVESDDPRIKCIVSQIGLANVGALKREACLNCDAPYILEFDHDDELDREALAKAIAAFETTKAAFVFSDSAHVDKNGRPPMFRSDYGWKLTPKKFHGEQLPQLFPCYDRPELLPQNVSRIHFAPDHLRAWTADAYVKAGGHNAGLKVCDDLDLMVRIYLTSGGNFHYIPECLYKYNVHGENTWLKNTGLIADLSNQIHDANIENLALAHWKPRGKRCVDLGGGIDCPKGWEACDTHDAAVTTDLDKPWPFESNSVGVFRAHDIIEHLRNPVHVMNEAYRCLVHGGLFCTEVPSTDGRGAFQDPTHVSFWNANSFWYYTKSQQARYLKHASLNCRFQAVRILDYFPSEWHQTHRIPYVKAHLAAIKDGPRLHGPIEIS